MTIDTISTKMSADSLPKNTPNAPEFICPICLPKPKRSGFQWKKASLGVRSLWIATSTISWWNCVIYTAQWFWSHRYFFLPIYYWFMSKLDGKSVAIHAIPNLYLIHFFCIDVMVESKRRKKTHFGYLRRDTSSF